MFHRATIEAIEIYGVAILPIVPDLINHLLSSIATSVVPPLTNTSVITYSMMQKENWVCIVHQRQCKGKGLVFM